MVWGIVTFLINDALLIYFTDGFGEYPKKALDFETVFVFCIDDEFIVDDISVPSWAMKLILSKNDLLED